MRLMSCAALVAAMGCSSKSSGTMDPGSEPDPKGWTITIDMSGLDRFVQPSTETMWTVGGVATATDGLQSLTVDGALVETDSTGAFSTSVAVAPGLTRVAILATDELGHTRKGDRHLLTAPFLPDTAYNPEAANLVLTNAVLSAMSESIASYATGVDVAGEIMKKQVLSQDDRCVTWPVQASQGKVTASLVGDQGNLWLNIKVPTLYVYFQGRCQGLIQQIPIAGEMRGTIDVWTRLTPKPPADGGCLSAFAHTKPQVQIAGWQFDVWGTGGPLQSWIVELFSGSKSTEARQQLTTEVGGRADQLLAQKLSDVVVFERSSEMELLGKPLTLDLCVAGLESAGGKLTARIAARAVGAGTIPAPGTPLLEGAFVRAGQSELVLDGNLIGQLLFAAWRDNGLARSAPDIDAGILQILVPGLGKEFPDATTAQIAIDAELPPYVRATPDGPGDLAIEMGDLMIQISIEGTKVLRFGAHLTLALDLTAMDGKLVPSVVDTVAKVVLLDERHDGTDEALETAVQSQLGPAAAKLLDGGVAIALPDIPGLGKPVAVSADPAGRFLHVQLTP
jgi:hypothetical protein